MVAPLTRRNGSTPDLSPRVDWFMPQPLWPFIKDQARTAMRARRNEPLLLRFASDGFMDELLALLSGGRGSDLYDMVAQHETWRDEDVGLAANGSDKPGTLKLFQPAHNRYYLVTGALACRIPGVPDRTIDAPTGETAFFVLRRLHNNQEYGWSSGALTAPPAALERGPYETAGGKGWFALSAPAQRLLASEERFPLFPMAFEQDGTTRRLLAGLVPVSSRETFQGGEVFNLLPNDDAVGSDPRPGEWEQRVVTALQWVARWYTEYAGEKATGTPERRRVEHALAFALLDMMDILRVQVPSVYDDIRAEKLASGLVDYDNAQALVDLMLRTFAPPGAEPDEAIALYTVLNRVESQRDFLENDLQPDAEIGNLSGIDSVWSFQQAANFVTQLQYIANTEDAPEDTRLQTAYETALEDNPYQPDLADFPEQPKLETGDGATYVIRMVYERPRCKMLDISQQTRVFQLAPFFDPDAPARSIRIRMPTDTSVGGLRKYNRGVSVIISAQLQKQMSRIKGLKELMDNEIKDEPAIDLGMICSFSIPIITIVALILLMIFVTLLNIIFYWLPLFRICIPIPERSE